MCILQITFCADQSIVATYVFGFITVKADCQSSWKQYQEPSFCSKPNQENKVVIVASTPNIQGSTATHKLSSVASHHNPVKLQSLEYFS